MEQGHKLITHARRLVGLRRILQPGRRSVVTHRKPSPGVLRFLSWLSNKSAPNFNFTTDGTDIKQDMLRVMNILGPHPRYTAPNPDDPAWNGFIDDVADLVSLYQSLSGASRINVSIRDNASGMEKFHVDGTPLRLLTVYEGDGTLYLSPGPTFDPDKAPLSTMLNEGEYDPAQIRQLRPFDCIIFKGRTWPGPSPDPLYHASPPGKGTDKPRLLVVIDGASQTELTTKIAARKMSHRPRPNYS